MNVGVSGSSAGERGYGVYAIAYNPTGDTYGVYAESLSTHGKGVYGRGVGGSAARGVLGEAASGHGVHGIATTGYAGYFEGKVYTTKFHEMKEMSAPPAPAANRARIFLRDNGSGKTQLCIRYSSGAVQVIDTQP